MLVSRSQWRSVGLRLALFFAIAALDGCAEGGGNGNADSGKTFDASGDAGSDATVDAAKDAGADAAKDAGADAEIPAIRADLFADVDYAGATRWVGVGATNTLGSALDARTSSVRVPTGYLLYGFSELNLGGTIAAPIAFDVAVFSASNNDTWRSVVLATTGDPFVTVYTDVGGGGVRYPIGRFPSLGIANDAIDGVSIPAGITLVAYADPDFAGFARTFVGPLATPQLPNRDTFSSLVVRATTAEDSLAQGVVVYEGLSWSLRSLVLDPGPTPDLDAVPGAFAFRNTISSVRSSNALAVWGFEYSSFGGAAWGPYLGASASVSGNDDWDSVFVVDASLPTYTIYLDPSFGRPEVRPLVDVPNLQSRNDNIDGILVPDGYRVFGFTDLNYGGAPRLHDAGQSVTSHDDWSSIRIVRADTPTVTTYLYPNFDAPMPYPPGQYADLVTHRNRIQGIDVPAGVHVCAFSNPNFEGLGWDFYGPFSTADLGTSGLNDWESMAISTGDTCP